MTTRTFTTGDVPATMGNEMVTAVGFSKDRPLQLDGVLRSLRLHCVDLDRIRISVLYVATTSSCETSTWR